MGPKPGSAPYYLALNVSFLVPEMEILIMALPHRIVVRTMLYKPESALEIVKAH